MDDVIFKYLNSEMTDSEISAFNTLLKSDASLYKQVEQISLLKAALRVNNIKTIVAKRKKQQRRWLRSVAIAASLLILISVPYAGYQVHDYNAKLAYASLQTMYGFYAEYSARGIVPEQEALDLYNNGDVQGALAVLDDVINHPDLNETSEAYFIKGAILLQEEGFNEEAIACLKKSESALAQELLDRLTLKMLY